ncbi:hypothetical protein AVEN_241107-1 [Araneus ventricosus]|uniref:Transposase Tc1-like domain-containing protein n=1 Tax=Araneus ventricosus TaxID=182803 RepID=A0A4Y2U8L2_ARAVE|nr:hypothetical protein AVEN_241107-1 [Araneus ventricosus]
MARSHKETTISIRKLIIFHHSSGKSVWNIAKLVNFSHSTVQYMLKRFKEENWIENKVRKGRSAKLTKCDQRFIIRKLVKNPRLSALKVSAEFNKKFFTSISSETVRRVLKAAGLNGRSACRTFLLSRIRSIQRESIVIVKKFELEILTNLHVLDLPESEKHNFGIMSVCVSVCEHDNSKTIRATGMKFDESKFNIFGSKGRIMVWRRKNEELNPKNLDGIIKYGGGGVLVWGCMSASGLGIHHPHHGWCRSMVFSWLIYQDRRESDCKLSLDSMENIHLPLLPCPQCMLSTQANRRRRWVAVSGTHPAGLRAYRPMCPIYTVCLETVVPVAEES